MENKAVILNKFETIEKCINRINEEYEGDSENLKDYRKMDMIILNLQRACEAVLDLAMYIVSTRKLGLPQNKRQAFVLLEENKIIDESMSRNMQGMVGFRNIAVHDYKEIDEDILKDVIENHLTDLLDFARVILGLSEWIFRLLWVEFIKIIVIMMKKYKVKKFIQIVIFVKN